MDITFHRKTVLFLSFLTLFIFCSSLFFVPLIAHSENTTPSSIIDNGDLLYVIIPKEVTSEFSPTERNFFKEKVEVDRHGFIFLPSQGNIKISGYTTAQISEILTNN
ncbi:MAG: polysaccharide biosynthesis/export family protein, partial [Desulfocapsa sp.]|nr:polysaccharide biosynthesis/export family protein [Desulfocapsa sp.]